jgi:hypothetical protein
MAEIKRRRCSKNIPFSSFLDKSKFEIFEFFSEETKISEVTEGLLSSLFPNLNTKQMLGCGVTLRITPITQNVPMKRVLIVYP